MNEEALYRLNYGVYIVSTKSGEKINGHTANSVFQVTAEPPKIAVCINKGNFTHELLNESGVFSVSILSEKAPMKLIGNFGFKCGRDVDKFKDVNYRKGKTGAPIILDYTVAYLEAEVVKSMSVGTHTLFVGKVVEAELLNDDKPMTYEYYHRELKGKEPEAAPTYRKKYKEDK